MRSCHICTRFLKPRTTLHSPGLAILGPKNKALAADFRLTHFLRRVPKNKTPFGTACPEGLLISSGVSISDGAAWLAALLEPSRFLHPAGKHS
jgi:hypothetical protein